MISIVVPVYNTEKFLDEAIQSVLNQTFSAWELLLVDDGSTDQSAVICQRYVQQDSRIKYFKKANGGQASARNVGIRHARFEWIAFLDSDDLWLPNKLQLQVETIGKGDPDFIYTAGMELHGEKTVAYEWVFKEFSGSEFFKLLYHSCGVNCNTVLVKKALLNEVDNFDENQLLRGVEDWDLWLRISRRAKKIIGMPEVTTYYRIHGGGIHHQMVRMFIGKLNVYKKYDHDKEVPRLVRLRQYRYVYRELMNFLFDEQRPQEIRPMMREFYSVDRWNPSTLKQRILVGLFSPQTFLWISNKLIYRIAYRLEYLSYLVFIPKSFRSK